MSAISNNTISLSTSSNQQPVDVLGMLKKLSGMKQSTLVNHLKDLLSARLGNALDERVEHFSGTYVSDNKDQITGIVLTSLKEAFLSTPLTYVDDIYNDFQSRYSKMAKGESFLYSIGSLRQCHKKKTDICTSTPNLDPLIQERLQKAVEADGKYVLGLKLDMDATQRQQQLVFAIFENEGEKEISRVLIPESKL